MLIEKVVNILPIKDSFLKLLTGSILTGLMSAILKVGKTTVLRTYCFMRKMKPRLSGELSWEGGSDILNLPTKTSSLNFMCTTRFMVH